MPAAGRPRSGLRALIAVVFAIVIGQTFGLPALSAPASVSGWPGFVGWPSWQEIEQGLAALVLPQLALTFTNAVILTALVAGDYFGERARAVTPRCLSVSSGIGNLALAPFGARAADVPWRRRSRCSPSLRGTNRRGAADAGPGASSPCAPAERCGACPDRLHPGGRPWCAAPCGICRARFQPAALGLQAVALRVARR